MRYGLGWSSVIRFFNLSSSKKKLSAVMSARSRTENRTVRFLAFRLFIELCSAYLVFETRMRLSNRLLATARAEIGWMLLFQRNGGLHNVRRLVRFDIEPLFDFTAKWSNFRGLVLGCIDSYDSNQIVILQGFSRSSRFAILCTAQISKFQQKFVKLFSNFA